MIKATISHKTERVVIILDEFTIEYNNATPIWISYRTNGQRISALDDFDIFSLNEAIRRVVCNKNALKGCHD